MKRLITILWIALGGTGVAFAGTLSVSEKLDMLVKNEMQLLFATGSLTPAALSDSEESTQTKDGVLDDIERQFLEELRATDTSRWTAASRMAFEEYVKEIEKALNRKGYKISYQPPPSGYRSWKEFDSAFLASSDSDPY